MKFVPRITSTGKFIQLLLRKPDGVTFDGGLQPMKCQGQLVLQNVPGTAAGFSLMIGEEHPKFLD